MRGAGLRSYQLAGPVQTPSRLTCRSNQGLHLSHVSLALCSAPSAIGCPGQSFRRTRVPGAAPPHGDMCTAPWPSAEV